MPRQAEGIPDRDAYGDFSKLKVGKIYDLITQLHLARRSGKHHDIRFGDKDTGLYSWATKKELPEPGGKPIALFQQPLHSHEYGKFEGTIPEGYGAGTVSLKDKGRALLTDINNGDIHFTTAHERYPQRFALIKPKDQSKRWLLINSTPTKDIGFEKVHQKNVKPEKVDSVIEGMQPGDSVQPKIDGASALIKLLDKHFDAYSYRRSRVKDGLPIFHTERIFDGRPKTDIPSDLKNTILKSELYGIKNKKVIPPHELGGLLNSSVEKSINDKKSRGIELKNLIYDLHSLGKKEITPDVPYEKRMDMIKDILKRVDLPKSFHLPEEAKTPEEARKLWNTVASNKHPLTGEGLVYHPNTGIPQKIKITPEHDVYIREVVPGLGKYSQTHAGGFKYSLSPDGEIKGVVGGGFDDATRKDMWDNPDSWIGRTARIKAQAILPNGNFRMPIFIARHEDIPQQKMAAKKKKKPSWVQHVMQNYASTNPPKGIFTRPAEEIVAAGYNKKVAPKGLLSWSRMVSFHLHRGGSKIPKKQRKELQKAIDILLARYHKSKEKKASLDLPRKRTYIGEEAGVKQHVIDKYIRTMEHNTGSNLDNMPVLVNTKQPFRNLARFYIPKSLSQLPTRLGRILGSAAVVAPGIMMYNLQNAEDAMNEEPGDYYSHRTGAVNVLKGRPDILAHETGHWNDFENNGGVLRRGLFKYKEPYTYTINSELNASLFARKALDKLYKQKEHKTLSTALASYLWEERPNLMRRSLGEFFSGKPPVEPDHNWKKNLPKALLSADYQTRLDALRGAVSKILDENTHSQYLPPLTEDHKGNLKWTDKPTRPLVDVARILLDQEYKRHYKNNIEKKALADSKLEYSPLARLLSAKYESDRLNYPEKHKILRELISEYPYDFFIDQHLNPHIVGIVHRPTGFKIHIVKTMIPVKLTDNSKIPSIMDDMK